MQYSFVLQGKIDFNKTSTCIKSIKNYFPNSEIIISSNSVDDSHVNVGQTKTIICEDPGELPSVLNRNLLRQIDTSFYGVQAAIHDNVIKMRNDLVFINNNLIAFVDEAIKQDKLLVGDYYTVDPVGPFALPYHTSDWLVAGHHQSLLVYYGNCKRTSFQKELLADCGKFRPEQWLNKANIREEYWHANKDTDNNDLACAATFEMFRSHFMMRSMKNMGFYCQKYPTTNLFDLSPQLMTEEKWERLWK